MGIVEPEWHVSYVPWIPLWQAFLLKCNAVTQASQHHDAVYHLEFFVPYFGKVSRISSYFFALCMLIVASMYCTFCHPQTFHNCICWLIDVVKCHLKAPTGCFVVIMMSRIDFSNVTVIWILLTVLTVLLFSSNIAFFSFFWLRLLFL